MLPPLEEKNNEVTIRLSDRSCEDLVNEPGAKDKMMHLVPSAFPYYELSDLIAQYLQGL